jgi:hypothetical protein
MAGRSRGYFYPWSVVGWIRLAEEDERERDELRRELYALREPQESPRTPEEQKGRGHPTPLWEELRRAHSGGRGGKEYSEDRRSMPNDQTVKDAQRLLRAFSTNHAEARMVSPHGMDRPFYPSWADAEQAGLDRVRRDDAMRWLVEKDMLESEEEPENPLDTGEGFYSKYGSVFRITEPGRELLEEA